MRPDSKVYVENIINNVNNKVRGSQFVSNIKVHFEKQYSAIFVDSLLESDLWLKLDVSLIEHEERVSKIYPYFVHASGILTIIDSKTETELYNQVIAEVKGSDFNSIEKAGINALKNLAKQLVNNIFSQ